MSKKVYAGLIVLAFGAGLGAGYFLFGGNRASGDPVSEGKRLPDSEVDNLPDFPQPSEASLKYTRQRVKILIEMLASKNARPPEPKRGEGNIRFTKSYDYSLQIPVWLAVQQLLSEEEGAIDLLLGQRDDGRYSLSATGQLGYDANMTVSQVCQRIARVKLLCFENELAVVTKRQFSIGDKIVDEWTRRRKGLAATQIDGIDEALAFMRSINRESAIPIAPEATVPPQDEFDRLREENIRKLRAMRRLIVEMREPYRPKELWTLWKREMFGLPWATDSITD